MYPIFDKHFISDSYSSRDNKGTHKGVNRLEKFIGKATRNWTRQAWVLKCDVKKFFDSVDHEFFLTLVRKKIFDKKAMILIEKIVQSFEKSGGKGLPLGNVTSQLFANVYMNEFDQFVKHILRAKFYTRYCDDFAIVSAHKETLEMYIPRIRMFLKEGLKLDLHPNKISLRKARQGIDFLGYVVLPHRNVLRTKTKRRIFKKMNEMDYEKLKKSTPSYKGMLSHCKAEELANEIDAMLAQRKNL